MGARPLSAFLRRPESLALGTERYTGQALLSSRGGQRAVQSSRVQAGREPDPKTRVFFNVYCAALSENSPTRVAHTALASHG